MRTGSVAFVLLAIVGFGCTGEPDAAPVEPSVRTTGTDAPSASLTLGPSRCRYEGPSHLEPGAIEIALASTDGIADFDLWLLDDEHGYEEFVAHVEEEHRRIRSGEPPLGHPSFATLVAEASTDPTGEGLMAASLRVGVYAMACIRHDPEAAGIWAAGPVAVDS